MPATATVTALTAKNQKLVAKVYKLYRKYHELVNAEASEARQEAAYDNYVGAHGSLPKREQLHLAKQHYKLHGYV